MSRNLRVRTVTGRRRGGALFAAIGSARALDVPSAFARSGTFAGSLKGCNCGSQPSHQGNAHDGERTNHCAGDSSCSAGQPYIRRHFGEVLWHRNSFIPKGDGRPSTS